MNRYVNDNSGYIKICRYICCLYRFNSFVTCDYVSSDTGRQRTVRAVSDVLYIYKDPKEYTSLIGYLLIFAAFFDGKMEYMQHKKSLWAVRKVLKKYGSNPMGRKAFTELADRRKKLQITQKLWKIMIRTFSLGMKWRWYLLMSVGIKILVSCRVDERLSDTGIRKK